MKQRPVRCLLVTAFLWVAGNSSSALAATAPTYSPAVADDFPVQVYWGDTHLHSTLSVDAYNFNNRLPRSVAYRFARGQVVTDSNGDRVKLSRPLDFLLISDHAENLGVMRDLYSSAPALLATEGGRALHEVLQSINAIEDPQEQASRRLAFVGEGFQKFQVNDPDYRRSMWEQICAEADEVDEPGSFTAFIGYEWTSWGINTYGNLHRNVIFRDSADRACRQLPFSSYDSSDPQKLWEALEGYQNATGGEVLAIPHNGNTSDGEMFALIDAEGRPLSTKYAELRSAMEPLYEVTQIKGDSEAHQVLSPNDEFADYETWNSWNGKSLRSGRPWDDDEREKKKYEYARSAFKLGIEQQARIGANPFKYGLIGSSDSHTSLATVDEDNFFGKAPTSSPNPDRITNPFIGTNQDAMVSETHDTSGAMATVPLGWQMASSGYAAVWAEENTRAALFDAMQRRETYATTGSRMIVRFFGGWDFEADDAFAAHLARIGYDKGVPMGGDLTGAPDGGAPAFLIRAVRDPEGANLDRVQVIKGWLDSDGKAQEKVYDVALSDGRKVGARGKVRPVGSTVDVKNATYTNTIGAPELAVVWQDPEFNPGKPAFYYVRVLEIPTPRWTAYDAKRFNLDQVPPEVPMVTQERAYTSPIWYTP